MQARNILINLSPARLTILGQLPPRTIAIQDKCHPDNCHLRQLTPRTTATQDNCHLGQVLPRTIATQDNCHPENCYPETVA